MREFDKIRYELGDLGQPVFKVDPTPYEVIVRQVAEAIASDREGKVKRALIELGWTPPKED